MRAFLCSIDDNVWDVVEIRWIRPEVAKSTWDKVALVAANANSKALNAIFVVFFLMNFTRSLMLQFPRRHSKSWRLHMKDTKLQMLTACFEELKMSEDESFNSFYGKLN